MGWADVVVATCDDACPVVPGKRYISWNLPDPAGLPAAEVRPIRDEIERRIERLAAELGGETLLSREDMAAPGS